MWSKLQHSTKKRGIDFLRAWRSYYPFLCSWHFKGNIGSFYIPFLLLSISHICCFCCNCSTFEFWFYFLSLESCLQLTWLAWSQLSYSFRILKSWFDISFHLGGTISFHLIYHIISCVNTIFWPALNLIEVLTLKLKDFKILIAKPPPPSFFFFNFYAIG